MIVYAAFALSLFIPNLVSIWCATRRLYHVTVSFLGYLHQYFYVELYMSRKAWNKTNGYLDLLLFIFNRRYTDYTLVFCEEISQMILTSKQHKYVFTLVFVQIDISKKADSKQTPKYATVKVHPVFYSPNKFCINQQVVK